MHDFILIDINETPVKITFSSLGSLSYYKRVRISDKFIVNNFRYFSHQFADFKSFWFSLDNLRVGLSYYGVSIFTSSNICDFLHTLNKIEPSDERNKLIELCNIAIEHHKNLVHFGV